MIRGHVCVVDRTHTLRRVRFIDARHRVKLTGAHVFGASFSRARGGARGGPCTGGATGGRLGAHPSTAGEPARRIRTEGNHRSNLGLWDFFVRLPPPIDCSLLGRPYTEVALEARNFELTIWLGSIEGRNMVRRGDKGYWPWRKGGLPDT